MPGLMTRQIHFPQLATVDSLPTTLDSRDLADQMYMACCLFDLACFFLSSFSSLIDITLQHWTLVILQTRCAWIYFLTTEKMIEELVAILEVPSAKHVLCVAALISVPQ